MRSQIRPLLVLTLILFGITGLLYPAVVTGVAQGVFADKADGSPIERNGQLVGFKNLGQSFVDPETGAVLPGYLRGRPSSAVQTDGGLIISGGSNLGPTNAALIDRIQQDLAIIRSENGLATDALIPVDLITASGSGLDPDISPASADLQVARIAQQRGIPEAEVRDVISHNTSEPLFGVIGESRVNVLGVNLELDETAPMTATS